MTNITAQLMSRELMIRTGGKAEKRLYSTVYLIIFLFVYYDYFCLFISFLTVNLRIFHTSLFDVHRR